MEQLEVTVPEGAIPGSELMVQLADGRELNIAIPDGACSGQTLLVDVPTLQQDLPPTVEVTIPDGYFAGMDLTVDFDGRCFSILLPDGCEPGMVLQVSVPGEEEPPPTTGHEQSPLPADSPQAPDATPAKPEPIIVPADKPPAGLSAAERRNGSPPTPAADDFEDSMDEQEFEAFMNEPDSPDSTPTLKAAPPPMAAPPIEAALSRHGQQAGAPTTAQTAATAAGSHTGSAARRSSTWRSRPPRGPRSTSSCSSRRA